MIHAIDPGGGTGIATYDPGERTFTFETLWLLNMEMPHLALSNWLLVHVIPEDKVICEKFEFRKDDTENRDKIDYSAAEYVGVVKCFCQTANTRLIMQGSALSEGGFWEGDKKIKALGLWKPGQQHRHEMSALRHLLYYVSFGLGDDLFIRQLKGKL